MTADFARISVTAKISAYYRQFTDIAFAAEAAALIGANEAFAQIVREHALDTDKLTFYAPMFEARYKSITELIRKSRASQVLELASGYSLRALDLTQHGALRYVETDLSEVVATKLGLLDAIRKRREIESNPQHIVAVANALELEQLRNAITTFDRTKPLIVFCEGLIGYLTREETGRVAANVHALLSEFEGGWWIVPDFAFKSEMKDLPPERIRLREAISGVTQRQLDASAFDDNDDLGSFAASNGFSVDVRFQVDETPSFSSIAALGLSPALLERLRPVLRAWILTPKNDLP